MKDTLGETGIDVIAIDSPFGFVKAIRDHRPDLVLIDVALGIFDGRKLVELGRKNVSADCVLLLYSTRDTFLLADDVAASKADGFISKRTTGQGLVRAVNEWLERGRAGHTADGAAHGSVR